MVQMRNFHKRKSRLEEQRNNLEKQSTCECNIHPPRDLSSFSLQSISRKAKAKTALQALLLLIPLFSRHRLLIIYSSNNTVCVYTANH